MKWLQRNAEPSRNGSCRDPLPALLVQFERSPAEADVKLTVICFYQVEATIVKLPSAFVSPPPETSCLLGMACHFEKGGPSLLDKDQSQRGPF